jgi:hypothetical protein
VGLGFSGSSSFFDIPPKLCPDDPVFKELLATVDDVNRTSEPPLVGDIVNHPQPTTANLETVTSVLHGALESNSDPTRSSTNPQDHDGTIDIVDSLRKLKIFAPQSSVCFGSSGDATLLPPAVELKSEYTGGDGMIGDSQKSESKNRRTEFWGVKWVR